MDKVTIRRAEYAELTPFRSQAAREGASLNDARDVEWYVSELQGEIVAMFGLLLLAGGGARVKSMFVLKPHRGTGIGDRQLRYAVERCEAMCRSFIEGYFIYPAWPTRNGWTHLKVRNNGGHHFRRLL